LEKKEKSLAYLTLLTVEIIVENSCKISLFEDELHRTIKFQELRNELTKQNENEFNMRRWKFVNPIKETRENHILGIMVLKIS